VTAGAKTSASFEDNVRSIEQLIISWRGLTDISHIDWAIGGDGLPNSIA
jgi:hypothetical protein